MDDDFQELQRLLRLKRYETPSREYFEDFLFEFHRRQRAELLRRPLWRLVLDRVEGALPNFAPARYGYAGACVAAVAVTLLASDRILTSGPVASVSRSVASEPVASMHRPAGLTVVKAGSRLNILDSRSSLPISPELDFDRPRPAAVSYASSRPRYVLDTQPVSYEQPFSF